MEGGHKLLIFLKRKPGTSREAFRRYYEEHHVPLCLPYMAGPTGYVRRFLQSHDGQPEPEFDVVTELTFPDARMRDATLAAMSNDAMPADAVADELKFIDRSKTRCWAITECETKLAGVV